MCGISGLMYADSTLTVSPEDVKRMCRTLVHRGPDDEGFYFENNVGLGMRRLNIIDLHTGRQPITNETGSVWIVFNGEIYNFLELRSELEGKGHVFATHTDTETIVHAYEEYGDDCVQHLNGMFAFAIWDRDRERLLLARDRIGVKPLFYFVNERFLAFGSELKALLAYQEIPRSLDFSALDVFLTFEYIPAPLSIFRGIYKLPPGHTLVFQKGEIQVRKYWELKYNNCEIELKNAEEGLMTLLRDAVRLRLRSDVPLGAFLSGGIDSSAIVGMMVELVDQPVKTFSIGFDDPSYNELKYAKIVANTFGTDHHELVIQPDIVNLVEELIGFLDEPLADVSVFPTYLVSKLTKEYVTVALSGDGGDELFAGYDWYMAAKLDRTYRKFPEIFKKQWLPTLVQFFPPSAQKKGLINKCKRFVHGASLDPSLQHFRWNLYLTDRQKRVLYSKALKRELESRGPFSPFVEYLNRHHYADPLWQQQFADTKTFLVDDILVKVDRMSMAHSLECRNPFLDYRLVEFAFALPSRLKLNGFQTKYILKRCMAHKLPKAIQNRKKEGFSIPMKNWLRGELRPMLEHVLSSRKIKEEGFFNPDFVEKLKFDHLKGLSNNSHLLWSLMTFHIWKDRYLT